MKQYRTYKFMVVPVIQEVDDDGMVIQEMSPQQPVAVFGVNGLHAYADGFEAQLAASVADNGGVPAPQ